MIKRANVNYCKEVLKTYKTQGYIKHASASKSLSKNDNHPKYASAVVRNILKSGLRAAGKSWNTSTVGDAAKVLGKHLSNGAQNLSYVPSALSNLPKSARGVLKHLDNKFTGFRNAQEMLTGLKYQNPSFWNRKLDTIKESDLLNVLRPRKVNNHIFGPSANNTSADSIMHNLMDLERKYR